MISNKQLTIIVCLCIIVIFFDLFSHQYEIHVLFTRNDDSIIDRRHRNVSVTNHINLIDKNALQLSVGIQNGL
jgi:hypothetical protein